MKGLVIVSFICFTCFYLPAQSHSSVAAERKPGSFYISNEGDDRNPGTKARPFKSVNRINALYFLKSDTLLFKGSEIFAGHLHLFIKGTKEYPVLITSYGKGRATINGSSEEAIVLYGSGLILKNINAKGSGRKTGNTKHGILLTQISHAIIENIRTEGFQKSGIEVYRCSDIRLKKIYALNNGSIGISFTESKGCILKDSKAENNPGDPSNLTNHSGNGILVGFSDSITIDHCSATNNGWDMPRIGNGPVGIWAYESNHVVIQYCISYKNKTSKGSSDGGGFDLDGGVKNSIVQYCLSYENQGSGYGLFQYSGASGWVNNAIRYCISINDGQVTGEAAGILVWNSSNDSSQLMDCSIHNNVIYNSKGAAVNFLAQSANKGFGFYNNILVATGNIVNGPSSGEKFTGNVWWTATGQPVRFRGYKNLAEWSGATGQEIIGSVRVGLYLDPLLRGPLIYHLTDPYRLDNLVGYKLLSGSPIINKGIDIQGLFGIRLPDTDFYGTKIPQGSAIEPGIYEAAK